MTAPRIADVRRDTKETKIRVRVNLDGTGVSLHIDNLKGHNAHHQCETIFKAFGRALRMAMTLDPRSEGVIPSTKGSL